MMKKYLIISSLTLLTLLPVGQVSAQSKLTEEQKQELKARYEAYKERLNLSEDQSVKVESINRTYFEQLATLRNSDDSKLSKYRKYKDIKSTRDRQMKAVLDKEQYKTYESFQKEMKEEFKENRRQQ
ncbi:hypothetical protein QNI19_27165 [Cytophagaceae bacterium DM2B3-1]|uniref:DUF4890 domain-containing protein n=1 Tax=Xanthocytophaga flava TaxID=3048013 RepID=A0ABT7CSD9_9BACT|nr:hypothetical protein [Xanthocytophaga flavus]MDJ1496643.1 hypothetical protein [Xanthocytophaga flavus]